MPQSDNPYQPPAAFEEDDLGLTASADSSVDLQTLTVAFSLIVLFLVSVVIFHWLATGLGVISLSLALLLFMSFSAVIVVKLIKLFQKL